jgi:hypothetical protein
VTRCGRRGRQRSSSCAPLTTCDHTRAIIRGGQDLTAVAEELASSMRVLTAALPEVLDGLSSVEELEDSVGTVADTGAAAAGPHTGSRPGVRPPFA